MGATAVCAGFVATLSHATAPGTNGRIAFMRYRLHDAPYQAEIFTVNSDGSGERKVTHVSPGLIDDEPDWSPNGSLIVFQRCGRGRCLIWSVLPDGTRILFNTGGNQVRDQNLFTVRPDGTGLRQLTHFRGKTNLVNGSFSPDGESIVFATVIGAVNPPGAGLDDVFVMSADGTDIRPVTRARNWDGTPDGGRARSR